MCSPTLGNRAFLPGRDRRPAYGAGCQRQFQLPGIPTCTSIGSVELVAPAVKVSRSPSDGIRHYKFADIGAYQQRTLKAEVLKSDSVDRHSVAATAVRLTVCIAGGRKGTKVRPGDVLGALTGEAGLGAKFVGKIQVMDQVTYVAIQRSKPTKALGRLLNGKIRKGFKSTQSSAERLAGSAGVQ